MLAESERKSLGRRLATARVAADLTQRQLAAVVGYSRSTVSNAELGHPDVARGFFVRCDQALDTGQPGLTVAFDQARLPRAERPGRGPDTRRAWQRVRLADPGEALGGYRELGWPVRESGAGLELVTGDEMEALEVPRAAGMLAAALWQYCGGRADPLRMVPALPDPAAALVVIAAADRCWFLTAAGAWPWADGDPRLEHGHSRAGPEIRWHGDGSRIPAPPSAVPDGPPAQWACTPSHPVRLPPPAALLGLLGPVVAAAGQGQALTLPGAVQVTPVQGLHART